MRFTPRQYDSLARLAKLIASDRAIDHGRRLDHALTDDGHVRGSQIVEQIPEHSRWSVESDEVGLSGEDADNLKQFLAALGTTYLRALNPAFTGALTGPDGTFSGTVQAVNLIATASATLGNSASDVILDEGHTRHKGNAPSIAVGVALGTGGSVAATIDGTDEVGVIRLVAGTTSLTTGVLGTITYASARPNTNYAVTLEARNSTAGVNAIQRFVLRDSASAWTIRCNVAPGSGLTYDFHYRVKEFTN